MEKKVKSPIFEIWQSSIFLEGNEISRQINSLVGGRDVAFFNVVTNITLDQNDYIYFQVVNNSGTGNLTLELNNDWFIEQR